MTYNPQDSQHYVDMPNAQLQDVANFFCELLDTADLTPAQQIDIADTYSNFVSGLTRYDVQTQDALKRLEAENSALRAQDAAHSADHAAALQDALHYLETWHD